MVYFSNMMELASAIKQDTNLKFEAIAEYPPNLSIISFPVAEDNIGSYSKTRSDEAPSSYSENYSEIEVIEIPEPKKMLFQFNKPVKLEFS